MKMKVKDGKSNSQEFLGRTEVKDGNADGKSILLAIVSPFTYESIHIHLQITRHRFNAPGPVLIFFFNSFSPIYYYHHA